METQYLNLMKDILENGAQKGDRTGTGTLSVFGRQLRCDLTKGFPLLTTKKMHMKSIVHELLWFISGNTNIKTLQENGVRIWDEWADENGDLGPVYGKQWRNFGAIDFPMREIRQRGDVIVQEVTTIKIKGVDQLANVVERIKTNPDCRRLIVTGWNPMEIGQVKLPPCHTLFQFYVVNGKLSCQLYQRSADLFLGVPFNIASYALLTSMVAQVTGLELGDFVHTFGDVHIYNNHIKQAKQQLQRDLFDPPDLLLNKEIKNLFDFKFDDVTLGNYHSHPPIKARVSI